MNIALDANYFSDAVNRLVEKVVPRTGADAVDAIGKILKKDNPSATPEVASAVNAVSPTAGSTQLIFGVKPEIAYLGGLAVVAGLIFLARKK